MIFVLKACRREIHEFPEEIRGDLADALARLDAGQTLTHAAFPSDAEHRERRSRNAAEGSLGCLSRGLCDRDGRHIYVVHGFKKTTRTTAKRNIEIARKRMMEVGR